MNCDNRKTSDPHRLLLKLTGKKTLREMRNMLFYQTLAIDCTWKNIKSSTKIINSKYQSQYEMKNLIYLMYHILYQIFKIILNIS